MKRLYLIGGTMGVGKTTVSQRLKRLLPDSVFLDGDWCWDADPFQVTEETKAMVLENICAVLGNFLRCSAYRNIIFCWVMDHEEIRQAILSRLDVTDCEVISISLVCSPEALTRRLQRDVDAGLRTEDVIGRSLTRLPLYDLLPTVKLDASSVTAEEAARQIASLTQKKHG